MVKEIGTGYGRDATLYKWESLIKDPNFKAGLRYFLNHVLEAREAFSHV